MSEIRRKLASQVKRVVVKVGSHVLADPDKGLREDVLRYLAKDISCLRDNNIQVVIVTSGAIAAGMKKLGFKKKPRSIPQKQAAAAAGQSSLMWLYEKAFEEFSKKVAQVLLIHEDLSNRKRFLNARNTLVTLLNLGVIPVINENDTVAVDEIKFGDNDYLSVLVTNLVGADLLTILTNTDGLYDKDPRINDDAELIPLVEDISTSFIKRFGGPSEPFGTGGIRSKVEAAEKASHFGISTIIANGRTPGILARIFQGEDVGTLFLPKENRLSSRKHWIAFSIRPAGNIRVDDGAEEAIVKKGKSLLPSGIVEVNGGFGVGDAVSCIGLTGKEFARGLVNYSADEVSKIKGFKTSEIEGVLGYKYFDEVIHRDDLVVLK